MGSLTVDMRRLREEVESLRDARNALMNDLRRGTRDLTTAVAVMRDEFMSTQAAMAEESRGERMAFVAAVIDEVNSLIGTFSRDRNDMAREGRDGRGVFLTEMRRQVKDLRNETASDLMGARLAWRSESPGKLRPVLIKKEAADKRPLSPLGKAVKKEKMAASEIKQEKSPLSFKETLKREKKDLPLWKPAKVTTKEN
ncbi:MAG: hypothetical protein HY787_06305 [Deltaproteobacteria bacterium]|nr:hypothetical protein [Deltaproteobacteria bacterium]